MNPLTELGKILKTFVKSSINKIGALAFLNLLIIFGLLLYSAIPFIGEEASRFIYVVGDLFGQLVLDKHVVQEVDHISLVIYLLFILAGFVICMYFVRKDKEGDLW